MFIASIICLILGIALLIVAGVLFFKLDVREAFAFVMRKKSGKSVGSVVSGSRRRPSLSSAGKAKLSKKRTSGPNDTRSKINKKTKKIHKVEEIIQEEDTEKATDVLDVNSEDATGILSEDSEKATGILEDDSESPTGILDENSEDATGILNAGSEDATGILQDSSEQETGVLVYEDSENSTDILEDSENETGILPDTSEQATGVLRDVSEQETGILEQKSVIKKKSNVKSKKKAKTIDSDFKFEIVKEIVVVHTEEDIE